MTVTAALASGLTIRPLTPTIGAEIHGVDLENPADDELEAIRDALTRHQVVFFRDQDISVEAQKAFGARFGTLDIHPNDPGLVGHPEVMIIHADEKSKRVAGEMWHSDVSCAEEPPMGSILRIFVVPESGGDTMFASMYAAYDALSDRMKAMLDGLDAVHDGGPYYRSVNAIIGRDDGGRVYPKALHPVLRTHPVSGRKSLYVNSMFTTRIVGLPAAESDAVLGFLFDHVKNPQFQCRFRWERNSIAFWDNRCTQHYAVWDYFPQVRSGYRVTVRGERPQP
jgi:alpha-ketoglutarate-dependent taurine dioxygenase